MNQPDEIEARAWVATEILKLRDLSYGELAAREGDAEHRQMSRAGGKPLILETQIFWDDADEKNLRVVVDVWDPARRISFGSIARDDFIRAPDGSFIGE
jgi:hypothetical protein